MGVGVGVGEGVEEVEGVPVAVGEHVAVLEGVRLRVGGGEGVIDGVLLMEGEILGVALPLGSHTRLLTWRKPSQAVQSKGTEEVTQQGENMRSAGRPRVGAACTIKGSK